MGIIFYNYIITKLLFYFDIAIPKLKNDLFMKVLSLPSEFITWVQYSALAHSLYNAVKKPVWVRTQTVIWGRSASKRSTWTLIKTVLVNKDVAIAGNRPGSDLLVMAAAPFYLNLFSILLGGRVYIHFKAMITSKVE